MVDAAGGRTSAASSGTEGPTIRVDGLAVYDRVRPGGPRVVFVHGSMDRSASFVKAIRRLPAVDARRYDRRGYGRSVDLPLVDGVEGQVDDLLRVIDDRPSVVVGHSMGGLLALAAAQRRPELVPALVVFEAPMPWADWWPAASAGGSAVRASETAGIDAAAETFMRRMIGDARWEKLPPSTKAARRREGRALLHELRAVRAGGAAYDASAIEVPVVVGSGSESDEQHRHAARALAEAAPDATLVVIEGAGHGAHASHPVEFAALVTAALERLDAPRQ